MNYPSDEFMDYGLIPHVLHIPPHELRHYSEAEKGRLRLMAYRLVVAGWAGNLMTVKTDTYGF